MFECRVVLLVLLILSMWTCVLIIKKNHDDLAGWLEFCDVSIIKKNHDDLN
jgi:hypothetical protein